MVDDELNVLPISGGKSVRRLPPPDPEAESRSSSRTELERMKQSLQDAQPVGSLITLAKTVDQAKALLTFVDAVAEKTLQSTVALTAARGRGKSAALGVAIAAAVAHGYSNIFITSPSPENLKTLFEFVFKGFDALGYMDHVDYTIIQSTNPEFNKAIVRVNIHRQHRQTIQYIQPQDAHVLGQAELLIIDEAAAIPLPLVRKLMGPYLVFMASTINGYEGTGRSLSLKLINQLREQSRGRLRPNSSDVDTKINGAGPQGSVGARSLREITLSEPIRYASGDAVEKWLNRLLCLDATLPQRSSLTTPGGTPHPSQCQLLAVNRDTLFSFHPVSERFLQSMLSLYVASHYKNSPNDLQLMSDAPAHLLYVLVPPVSEQTTRLPEPLCVVQVAFEGQISKDSVHQGLSRGQRSAGDLIPWLVSQQFQDDNFGTLSGARIVRIATNPDYISMGYGARALSLLLDFFAGKFLNLAEDTEASSQQEMIRVTDEELEKATLHTDSVKVRDIHSMPPLFSHLSESTPPSELDYVGVSYGLTQPLHKFWKRAGFVPVYLRQTPNELTGEHTCVMLRTLSDLRHHPEDTQMDTSPDDEADSTWLPSFARDFHRRFLALLSYNLRAFPAILALSIDESAGAAFRPKNQSIPQTNESSTALTKSHLDQHFTPHDLRRLDSYAANMLDHHVILDLLPSLAQSYFSGPLRNGVRLSGVQSALLIAVGCQRRAVEDVGRELGLQGGAQVMGMFVKLVRRLAGVVRGVVERDVGAGLPGPEAGEIGGSDENEDGEDDGASTRKFRPLDTTLDEELAEDVDAEKRAERERARAMIDSLPLDRYEERAGGRGDDEWKDAERVVAKGDGGAGKPTTVSVKKAHTSEGSGASKRKAGEALGEAQKEAEMVREKGMGGKKKKGK